MLTAICIVLGKVISSFHKFKCTYFHDESRAGRFGTKGLAITFISSETDQTVMNQIQSRFEVAVSELPDKIDSASYSEYT